MKIGPYDLNKVHQGDALERLKDLPDESIHCCITSPPYWGLRDYGTASWEGGDPACDHKIPAGENDPKYGERKNENSSHTLRFNRTHCYKCGAKRIDRQIGIEETPEAFVENLVKVFREVKRVLRKDATLWINIGDSYGRGYRSKFAGDKNRKSGLQKAVVDTGNYGIGSISKEKQLVGIPWRLAFALQDDGWVLRQDIIWHKPNPMPESVQDRCTKAHEYIFLLTKSERYFYDSEAVKEPTPRDGLPMKIPDGWDTGPGAHGTIHREGRSKGEPEAGIISGRNLRDVWTIATLPYRDAHFATFPPKLVEIPILAGTSEKGCCPKCGKGWRRVVEKESVAGSKRREAADLGSRPSGTSGGFGGAFDTGRAGDSVAITIGWNSGCKCEEEPIPCVVLDPFAGSGTTLAVAQGLGRNAIGFDLNEKYAQDIAAVRLETARTGMKAAEVRAGQKFMFEEE